MSPASYPERSPIIQPVSSHSVAAGGSVMTPVRPGSLEQMANAGDYRAVMLGMASFLFKGRRYGI